MKKNIGAKPKPVPRGRNGGRTSPVGGTVGIRASRADAAAIKAAALARGVSHAEVVSSREW